MAAIPPPCRCVKFCTCATVTGRTSCSDANLSNPPRADEPRELTRLKEEREAAIEAGAIALMQKHQAEAERDELVRALRAQAGAMCLLDGTIEILDKYKDVK